MQDNIPAFELSKTDRNDLMIPGRLNYKLDKSDILNKEENEG
jgi:hypothetical protein